MPLEAQDLPEQNVQLVKAYYKSLFQSPDFETLASLISEDAIYYQAEGLPYRGTYVGFDEWMKMFAVVSSYVDLRIEKEPEYLFSESGNQATMNFTIRCTSKASGQVLSMQISEQFELKDGKIVSIRPFYFDTKTFADFLEK